MLESRNFDVKEWLTKDMLTTVGISDASKNLEKDELLKKICSDSEEVVRGNRECLASDKMELQKLKKTPLDKFIALQLKEVRSHIRQLRRTMKDRAVKARKYKTVIKVLEDIESSGKMKSELAASMLKSAISYARDGYDDSGDVEMMNYCISRLHMTEEEWKAVKKNIIKIRQDSIAKFEVNVEEMIKERCTTIALMEELFRDLDSVKDMLEERK